MKYATTLCILLLITDFSWGQQLDGFQATFEISDAPTHKIPKGQEYAFGYLDMQAASSFFNNPQQAPSVPCFNAVNTPDFKTE